jgi:hypothetical protein
MHISPKKKNKANFAVNLFEVFPNEERSSDELEEADFQWIDTTMNKFRGHQGCTHIVVSEHRGGQDGWYDVPKKEKERKQ